VRGPSSLAKKTRFYGLAMQTTPYLGLRLFYRRLLIARVFQSSFGNRKSAIAKAHGTKTVVTLRRRTRSRFASAIIPDTWNLTPDTYSHRSATIGSTFTARRAGMKLATSVTNRRPANAAANEIGSPG
jgi:hypothetical protein